MQTKQTKTFQVSEPIEKVWKFLSDPRKVAPCLPGAQITEQVDNNTFKGTITVKIGPVTTSFKGEVKLDRLDSENYEMEISGRGQDPRGGGGATMHMIGKLKSLSGAETEVTGITDVAVTGKLAQFGARMMEDVSNHIFTQFTQAFQQRLTEENGGASPSEASTDHGTPEASQSAQPIKALPLMLKVVWAAIVRFFQKLKSKSS